VKKVIILSCWWVVFGFGGPGELVHLLRTTRRLSHEQESSTRLR
jgi:hypothetical protein